MPDSSYMKDTTVFVSELPSIKDIVSSNLLMKMDVTSQYTIILNVGGVNGRMGKTFYSFSFFRVHPLWMTTTSSSTLKVDLAVAEEANA